MEREKVIIRTSMVGIITNIMLAVFKAIVGIIAGSIVVVLDALNNLSDVISSVVTIIGTKLAGKKPDKEHPLGHGRAEYIGTMLVAGIILYAGIIAGKESAERIFNKGEPDYSVLSLVIIAAAVVVKIVLGKYVSAKGREVNSGSLIASGSDALFDAVLSSSVLASALIFKFSGINLEAYVGLLISAFIIRAGIEMLRETIDDILGKRMDRDVINSISDTICSDEKVLGAYDLILHSYGQDKLIGSVHVEVPADMTAAEIDRMERRITEKVYSSHGIILAGIGIYAIDQNCSDIRENILNIVRRHDGVIQIHGIFVDTAAKKLVFDVIIDYERKDKSEIFNAVCEDVQKAYPDWNVSVNLDIDI